MFVLLFLFIYADQFRFLPQGLDYVQFLMPGIFVQNAIFGVDEDGGRARRGPEDRHHRSVPLAADGAVGGARRPHDIRPAKNLLLVLIVIGIGYLVGFRFENGFLSAVGVVRSSSRSDSRGRGCSRAWDWP